MNTKLISVCFFVILIMFFSFGCDNRPEMTMAEKPDSVQQMVNLADKMQLELDLDTIQNFDSEGANVTGIAVKNIKYLPAKLAKNGVVVSILYFSDSNVVGDYQGLYVAKAIQEDGQSEPLIQLVKGEQIMDTLELNPQLENASEMSDEELLTPSSIQSKASCDYVGRMASYYKNGPRYTKTKCIGVVYLCKNYVWHPEWDCPGYKASSWKVCGACFGFSW
ncbi:MAG: hypothetical protein JXR70_12020 [Spirochaetales bacterium]|nr:hypothetical protein [Spirochaetales bacterium]